MIIDDTAWWLPTLTTVAGLVFGYIAHLVFSKLRISRAREEAKIIHRQAQLEAELVVKDARLKAQEEARKAWELFEEETRVRKAELRTIDERVTQRETNLERKVAVIDRKEQSIDAKLEKIEAQRESLEVQRQSIDDLLAQQQAKLEEIAHLTQEQATKKLMAELEEGLKSESGALIRRYQEEAKSHAERQAREIITNAVERYAADQVNEITTSVVVLPSEDMKGRIIGREGRNIRSIESATGVNILIDDTPGTVVISGFDPLRREVAKIALERLMADGRIHPARIEEVVKEVRDEIEQTIRSAGEQAIYELDIKGVAPEVLRTLGRLKFRHSYSQNILVHSVEMAHIMGMLASQVGLDPQVAKRCGLFHDLGKALTHEIEGSHALIGADILRRNGESAVVVNAVASHHDDVPMESLYAVLVKAADAITAARPGARSETTELYIKRLEKLEEIATSFRGVENCYAIQAGREVRVIVEPSKISDDEAMQMARNISRQIEEQLKYPGSIKVTVIRETRCVEYAR